MRQLAYSLLLLAACGDNVGQQPDAGPADAAPTTPPRAVIVTGDFTNPGPTGVMSSLDLGTMQVSQRVAPSGAVSSDTLIRKYGDELFVVNRDENNITIVDASTFALVEQLGTGAGSNPQDVAVFGNKLYVPAFGTAGVVVATRGATTTTTIDLSDLDPDGEPNCISAQRVGSDIYVACGLLDPSTFSARGPGKIAVIDAATDTVKTTLTLSTANPFPLLERMPSGDLVIPTAPAFGNIQMGCIERIAISGGTATAAGCIVSNADLGGFVGRIEFQMLGDTLMMWMVVNSPSFDAAGLEGYDLTTNTLWPDAITPATQLIGDVAVCPDGRLVVTDKTMAANGLRVYEGGAEKTTAPLAVGLSPQSSRGVVCY